MEVEVVVVAGPAGILAEEPRLYQIGGAESADGECVRRLMVAAIADRPDRPHGWLPAAPRPR